MLDLLSPVLWPLAIAAVVAYLLDPVVGWLERRKVPRTRAIVLVFVVALSLVTTVLASVIPQVIVEVHQLIVKAPTYVSNLRQRGEQWVARSPDFVRQVLPVKDVPPETNAAFVVTQCRSRNKFLHSAKFGDDDNQFARNQRPDRSAR